MDVDFKKAKQLIDQSQNILLTMHERMDGDDGGSLLALARQLVNLGKSVKIAVRKGVPANLAFLPGSEKVTDDFTDAALYDLIIVCGCSSINRVGETEIRNFSASILNIDHHPDNGLFGQVNIVDATSSSVAELVYDLFKFSGWPIDKEVATCLLTGIIADTGGFMHSNTNAKTLKVTAELMKKGALVDNIIRNLFNNKSIDTLRAWGRAMENSFYDEKNKIIYSVMTESDLKEFGDLPQSAFEGFAVTLNAMPEAKFALFLRQDGNTIKGSLRSDLHKNTDVAKIAKLFGGGGHKLAAGFSVAGKLMKGENGKWKVV